MRWCRFLFDVQVFAIPLWPIVDLKRIRRRNISQEQGLASDSITQLRLIDKAHFIRMVSRGQHFCCAVFVHFDSLRGCVGQRARRRRGQ